MNKIRIEKLMSEVNRGHFRRSSIPMELASGWPCIHYKGKCLCMTLPYFYRKTTESGVALYPLYCTVTVPLENAERIMDFTIFPLQRDCGNINFSQPVGSFPHEILRGVTRTEYKQMCNELFSYYDELIVSIKSGNPFTLEDEMAELMSRLMEPSHYEQYQRIDKRFFSRFCTL